MHGIAADSGIVAFELPQLGKKQRPELALAKLFQPLAAHTVGKGESLITLDESGNILVTCATELQQHGPIVGVRCQNIATGFHLLRISLDDGKILLVVGVLRRNQQIAGRFGMRSSAQQQTDTRQYPEKFHRFTHERTP